TSLKLIVKKTKLFLVLNISKFVPGRSYVYFHLRKPEPIPNVETFEEASRIMPQYFELGCLNQHPLICFDKTISLNPPENNLLGEIEFWKTQQLQLSICTDQMSHSTISKTIKILKLAEVDIRRFETNMKNIEDLLSKVTDNMTYLSLLEQNAKYLLSENSKDDSKKVLFDSFVILKVAWVQSDYFNTDENMCRLLKGISMLIQNRVKKEAQINTLFRKPLSEALQELHNIFRTNLKFFVEDREDLSIMQNRIFGMTSVIQFADVDAFNPIFKSEWDRIIRIFFRDVQSFEDQMKLFIGKMFQTSLTWENAYILCKSFDKFSISSSIREFILKSRIDMLKQFIKEISETENHFLTHERDPPKLEAIPQITSAILWVQHLLKKISKPMSKIGDFLTKATKDIE
ncbi:dynein-1-alpha heavy chain, flagellar inner arm I1 complex, partial [Trichonephila clavata]